MQQPPQPPAAAAASPSGAAASPHGRFMLFPVFLPVQITFSTGGTQADQTQQQQAGFTFEFAPMFGGQQQTSQPAAAAGASPSAQDWFQALFAPLLSQAQMGVTPEQYAAFLAGGAPKPRIASKSAVDALPTVAITQSMVDAGSACAVCQCDYEVGEQGVVELGCTHKLHRECLLPWLREHNSCPCCRYELLTDDPAYNEDIKARQKAREDAEAEAKNKNQLQAAVVQDPLQSLATIPLPPLGLVDSPAAASTDSAPAVPAVAPPTQTGPVCALSQMHGSPCTLLSSSLSQSPISLGCSHFVHAECLRSAEHIRTGRFMALEQQHAAVRCPCCNASTLVDSSLLREQVAPQDAPAPQLISPVLSPVAQVAAPSALPAWPVPAAPVADCPASPAWSVHSGDDDSEMAMDD